ncbi:hypothetical protein NQ314_016485 [Rhamnusium bicolor]|uniref:YqaJ viral recombinase domain-containing protein n=1 Tax=Rhamnusium bicolor TaxID=1586634 RepID=A0AAV8WW30_9CUCU|nr:hypothetical protein NQ314_016485 [Rhamnusium bicolor]
MDELSETEVNIKKEFKINHEQFMETMNTEIHIKNEVEEHIVKDTGTDSEDFVEGDLEIKSEEIDIKSESSDCISNANWYVARKHRLTASKFGIILSACKKNKFPPSLFKSLTEEYNLTRISTIQWGKDNEATALQEFKTYTNLNVQPSGLCLDSCAFLGASPDGLINEGCVLGIKCPFKYRSTNFLRDAINDVTFTGYDENDQIVMNTQLLPPSIGSVVFN